MVQKGYLTERDILHGIYTILVVALLMGIYLATIGGTIIVCIGVTSFIFAYLYTATKYSIAYNGYGELFVFIYKQ